VPGKREAWLAYRIYAPSAGSIASMSGERRDRWEDERRATLAAQRRRPADVPIEERLLETIA
jgi:hypothetical protein